MSGNPGGRVALTRAPSQALAELNDLEGSSPKAIVEKFKKLRGKKLCAADFKAIAMFMRESSTTSKTGVNAFNATTDRLEGKVAQRIDVGADADTMAAIAAAAKAARS